MIRLLSLTTISEAGAGLALMAVACRLEGLK
jgi:hypothetical protein